MLADDKWGYSVAARRDAIAAQSSGRCEVLLRNHPEDYPSFVLLRLRLLQD